VAFALANRLDCPSAALPSCAQLTRTLFSFVLIAWAGISYAAPASDGREPARIGVLAIETRAVAPQLIRRLRQTVVETLKADDATVLDLIDNYPFVADCRYTTECYSAALRRFNLGYVVLVRLVPTSRASQSRPEHEIVVSLGRMPHDTSAWGPWTMSTSCVDCSDTDLTESARQLVLRTWKSMKRAELAPQNIEVTAQDRRNKGAKLLAAAGNEQLSAFEQIYLLKKAIQAGAGGPAFLELADIFFNCQGYQEAEDYLAKAAAKGAKTDSLRGAILWFTGRWPDAEPVFERLAESAPQEPHLQRALAELKRRNRDYRSLPGQAEAELASGDAIKAAQLARIALAAGRGTKAHLVLAKAALESGNYADALAQFLAVLDADPNNADAIAGKKRAEDGARKMKELRARR
jgi:hypothetical protein